MIKEPSLLKKKKKNKRKKGKMRRNNKKKRKKENHHTNDSDTWDVNNWYHRLKGQKTRRIRAWYAVRV